MNVCCGSCENARSHTDPDPRVSPASFFSVTNVPSVRNTCRRSLTRSQTYTNRSADTIAQCTGLRNDLAAGAFGS